MWVVYLVWFTLPMTREFMRYAFVGHRTVKGWLRPEVLFLCAVVVRAQGGSGAMAEIGVHHGRFFIGLHLLRREGFGSLAIDIFDRQDLNIDLSGKGSKQRFIRNLKRHAGGLSDVVLLAADSTDVTPVDVSSRVGRVLLFSVDGGHTPETVESDMRLAAETLVEGGVIISDDVFNEQWPGVIEGTLSFLKSDLDVVPFAVGFNKVFFTQAVHVDRYAELFEAYASRRLWDAKRTMLFGHPVLVLWRTGMTRKAKLIVKRQLTR